MLVLKAPFNGGSMKEKESIDEAPILIEEASQSFYMNESEFLPVLEFEDIELDNSNVDESHKAIRNKVADAEYNCILLGGDHSITLPAFDGFSEGKENPGIVVFDAHPDLMQSFGTHEDYLRTLIEKKGLKPENVILVGLRNFDNEEIKFMKKHKIKHLTMKRIAQDGIDDICDTIMMNARKWSDLYLSIDIDVLDPAFAPGVSYREPGGLTTRELLHFVHRLKNLKNLKMADIVEVNPKKDVADLTVKAAAKLLVELA